MPLKGGKLDPEASAPPLTVVPTLDGSVTLLHRQLNQTYHSLNGALQEARHVFLQQGLCWFLQQNETKTVRVLEVGFGAGLNFLVTAAHCLDTGTILTYTGIEPFPVAPGTLLESNYYQHLPGAEKKAAFLNWYPGPGQLHLPPQEPHLSLQLRQQKVQEIAMLPAADIIYFDAFAPATQPEMWTSNVIEPLAACLSPGGIFVSYSITGNLKRMLRGLGFRIEKPSGASGKREMIRAVKGTPV